MSNIFYKKYIENLTSLIKENYFDNKKIILFEKKLLNTSLKKNKVFIFGNGGSAAIASHFSVDLTKTAGIECTNFNESSLLTCFSNDYGYENWVSKAIEFYVKKNDMVIFISSSGNSKNMINGCKFAKKKGIKNIITFTGFDKKNKLRKLGEINFWVNSKIYNYVENIHQIILLSVVDSIIKKKNR